MIIRVIGMEVTRQNQLDQEPHQSLLQSPGLNEERSHVLPSFGVAYGTKDHPSSSRETLGLNVA
jgi:hypothetical protein